MKRQQRTMHRLPIAYLFIFMLTTFFITTPLIFAKDKPVVKLKYGSYIPRSSLDDPVFCFFSEVSKRSGVKIDVDPYFSGTLAKPQDCLNAIGIGVYDIGWISSAYTPGKLPYAMMVASAPIVAKSIHSLLAANDKFVQSFKPATAEYKRSNVKYMFSTGVWHYDYIGTKPIKSLDDIKGVKARTYGYQSKAWVALGGVPITLSITESYDALQKGIVDGVLSQANHMDHTFRMSEVAKNFTKLNFGCCPAPVIINLDTWNNLPEIVKQTMLEVAAEMPERGGKLIIAPELEAIENMKNKGVIVNQLSIEEQKRLSQLGITIADQLVDDLSARGVKEVRKAMDIYLSNLDKYSKEE